MTTTNKFKETEIGEIPMEWEVDKLKKFVNLNMGQSPPGESYNERGEGIPFLQGNAQFGFKHPKEVRHTDDPKKICNQGDVLMSVRAPVGALNIADKEYCIGRGLCALESKNGNNWFLYYLLRHSSNLLDRNSSGSTFKSISKTNLSKLKFGFPPDKEQKAIAQKLTVIRNAIEQTQAVIEATEELKKSMMKHLFTYGPVPANQTDQVKLKDTEIGLVPEEWEIKKLGEISDIKSGGTPSRKNDEYWENGNIPWIKTGEVNYSTITDAEEKSLKEV